MYSVRFSHSFVQGLTSHGTMHCSDNKNLVSIRRHFYSGVKGTICSKIKYLFHFLPRRTKVDHSQAKIRPTPYGFKQVSKCLWLNFCI